MAEGDQQDPDDKTEAPTPRRLDKAAEEGQVALSRDAVGFATLLGASLAAALALPALGADMLRAMRALVENARPDADPALLAGGLLRAAGLALLPVLGATVVAAVLATFAQTGLPRSAKRLVPDLERLSPLATLKRMLGPDGLVELLRTVLKIGAVGAALWLAVDPAMLAETLQRPPAALLSATAEASARLVLAALFAFAAIAAIDVFWVRRRHIQQMRMTREDLRQEMKESEGDPQLKARRRGLQETRARRRMLAEIPTATVVITNPTHYAVALRYDRGQAAAPKLVARGVDSMAARIREAAEAHGVPVVRDPPLARALHRLEPDTEIPQEHWQAVAEIIAYVWRLRERVAGPGAAAHG